MSTPTIPTNIEIHGGAGFVRQVKGILRDFWKDTACEFPPLFSLKLMGRTLSIPNILRPVALDPGASFAANLSAAEASVLSSGSAAAPPVQVPSAPPQRWHALPGEVSEKMWGEGHILPAGDIVMDMLTAPLALTKDKVVLDLSAGLGATLRGLSMRVQNVKGLEADPVIAARGMQLSNSSGKGKQAPIEFYNLDTFSMPAIYDCMIARELFYRVADKGKLFYSIGAGIKLRGQVAFTDFIVDPENRTQPAIIAWQSFENNAKPLGLIEMAEAWAKNGFEIRASEDQTVFYRREIVTGVNRLVAALRDMPPPDADTKRTILREVETWVQRLSAIQQGMKFYRFHAVKS